MVSEAARCPHVHASRPCALQGATGRRPHYRRRSPGRQALFHRPAGGPCDHLGGSQHWRGPGKDGHQPCAAAQDLQGGVGQGRGGGHVAWHTWCGVHRLSWVWWWWWWIQWERAAGTAPNERCGAQPRLCLQVPAKPTRPHRIRIKSGTFNQAQGGGHDVHAEHSAVPHVADDCSAKWDAARCSGALQSAGPQSSSQATTPASAAAAAAAAAAAWLQSGSGWSSRTGPTRRPSSSRPPPAQQSTSTPTSRSGARVPAGLWACVAG